MPEIDTTTGKLGSRQKHDEDPVNEIPVIASIARPVADIEPQARKLALTVNALHIECLHASVIPILSQVGGGSLPGQELESRAVALKSESFEAEDLIGYFRNHEPPIFGQVSLDVFVLDMRTVALHEIRQILSCIRTLQK
ncbi:MAG: hypothetical protein ACUVRS_12540 [Armatimonadota bacterium]